MDIRLFAMRLLVMVCSLPLLAVAAGREDLSTPTKGVICDAYFCADAIGISDALTQKYLGNQKSSKLIAQGDFDRTAFTFANGIYCDTKVKMCRKDRYFGADGKPSGKIDSKTTQWLFPQ